MMKLARLLFLFLILSVSGYAQTKIISGRVTDDKGIGLQGGIGKGDKLRHRNYHDRRR